MIYIDITQRQIDKAIRIRKQRDSQFSNLYQETKTDLRYCGDLGEIIFNSWVKQLKPVWHLNNAAGKPDFTINDTRIDIKTVKRQSKPKLNYSAQITAKHKNTPIDDLFFMSYEYKINRLWLLGGISKKEFLDKATYYKAGDKVHDHYTIRQGHEIYNAPIKILKPPMEYLKKFN